MFDGIYLFCFCVITTEAQLMEDINQGVTAIARSPIAHARTKHININYHYRGFQFACRTVHASKCQVH